MKTYIVSVDFEVDAESGEGALEEARGVLETAHGLLFNSAYEPDQDAARVIGSAAYAEPYALDESCMYEHDHSKGGCEYHD